MSYQNPVIDAYHQMMMDSYNRGMQQQMRGLGGLLGGVGMNALARSDGWVDRSGLTAQSNRSTEETIRKELQRETNEWLKDAL